MKFQGRIHIFQKDLRKLMRIPSKTVKTQNKVEYSISPESTLLTPIFCKLSEISLRKVKTYSKKGFKNRSFKPKSNKSIRQQKIKHGTILRKYYC
jgi:hypothetical protein